MLTTFKRWRRQAGRGAHKEEGDEGEEELWEKGDDEDWEDNDGDNKESKGRRRCYSPLTRFGFTCFYVRQLKRADGGQRRSGDGRGEGRVGKGCAAGETTRQGRCVAAMTKGMVIRAMLMLVIDGENDIF